MMCPAITTLSQMLTDFRNLCGIIQIVTNQEGDIDFCFTTVHISLSN